MKSILGYLLSLAFFSSVQAFACGGEHTKATDHKELNELRKQHPIKPANLKKNKDLLNTQPSKPGKSNTEQKQEKEDSDENSDAAAESPLDL